MKSWKRTCLSWYLNPFSNRSTSKGKIENYSRCEMINNLFFYYVVWFFEVIPTTKKWLWLYFSRFQMGILRVENKLLDETDKLIRVINAYRTKRVGIGAELSLWIYSRRVLSIACAFNIITRNKMCVRL